MLQGRSDFAVVSCRKCIYALGGQSGTLDISKNSMEYYKDSYWTQSIPMIELSACHMAVAFRNLISIVGGLNKNFVLSKQIKLVK